MAKKKRIGIMGWNVGDNTFGISKSYLHYISKFGRPVILTPDNIDVEKLDLLVLSGGADINPVSYGAAPNLWTNSPNTMLEWFDEKMLPLYIENKTPIFGICRGAQRLWTQFGGMMNQHNPFHEQSEHNWDQCHELAYSKEHFHMHNLLRKVNSRHHQTMDSGDEGNAIPENLEVIAWSRQGKTVDWDIVEIFKHTELPIFGIQGHPEDMFQDNLCPMVINKLLNGEPIA